MILEFILMALSIALYLVYNLTKTPLTKKEEIRKMIYQLTGEDIEEADK